MSSYDVTRALRFNCSYHEVNYIKDRLCLVDDIDHVTEKTKGSYLFELDETNSSPFLIQFYSSFGQSLETVAKKLNSISKVKRTKFFRKEIHFDNKPMPFPLDHSIKLKKLVVNESHVLPSAHSPILLTFETLSRSQQHMSEVTVEVLSFKAHLKATYKFYAVIRGKKLSLDGSICLQINTTYTLFHLFHAFMIPFSFIL